MHKQEQRAQYQHCTCCHHGNACPFSHYSSFFLRQYCPTENNKGKSGASQHLDRPVKLTGLDQVADVGGDAVIGLVCVVITPDPADGALALIFIICFYIKNPVHCTIGKLIVQFNG